MKVTHLGFAARQRRYAAAGAAVGGVALSMAAGAALAAGEPAAFVQDGKAGFVVTHIEYALSQDAKDTGVCPDGMTKGMSREGFGSAYSAAGPGGQRPAGAPSAPGAAGAPAGAQPAAGASPAAQRPKARQKCNVRQVNRKKQRQDASCKA